MSETLNVEGLGNVEVSFTERGSGQPVLLLHGGGGPLTVNPWAELLARSQPARVITPTYPGFGGTPRPEALNSVGGLARVHAALLDKLDLHNVAVVGNSIGGWLAAELALLAGPRISSLTIVNAAGLEVPGQAVVDVFALAPDELSKLSFHDPVRFRIDPSKLPPQVQAAMAGNRATLKVYGGSMVDSTLRGRLAALKVPTLVVWGESDRVIDAAVGRAYAQAIPGARFALLPATGHMPQLESPESFTATVWPFIAEHATSKAA